MDKERCHSAHFCKLLSSPMVGPQRVWTPSNPTLSSSLFSCFLLSAYNRLQCHCRMEYPGGYMKICFCLGWWCWFRGESETIWNINKVSEKCKKIFQISDILWLSSSVFADLACSGSSTHLHFELEELLFSYHRSESSFGRFWNFKLP